MFFHSLLSSSSRKFSWLNLVYFQARASPPNYCLRMWFVWNAWLSRVCRRGIISLAELTWKVATSTEPTEWRSPGAVLKLFAVFSHQEWETELAFSISKLKINIIDKKKKSEDIIFLSWGESFTPPSKSTLNTFKVKKKKRERKTKRKQNIANLFN